MGSASRAGRGRFVRPNRSRCSCSTRPRIAMSRIGSRSPMGCIRCSNRFLFELRLKCDEPRFAADCVRHVRARELRGEPLLGGARGFGGDSVQEREHILFREERLPERQRGQRDGARLQSLDDDGEPSRQARDIDTAARFVLAEVEALYAVGEQRDRRDCETALHPRAERVASCLFLSCEISSLSRHPGACFRAPFTCEVAETPVVRCARLRAGLLAKIRHHHDSTARRLRNRVQRNRRRPRFFEPHDSGFARSSERRASARAITS